MIRRALIIGRWIVDFLFCVDRYDVEGVLACLYDAGAPDGVMAQAEDLMLSCDYDCGFTYSQVQRLDYVNSEKHRAVVLIGPTSSAAEFLDTFVHEFVHLAIVIAEESGIDLKGEGPAYIAGDAARDFADVVCMLGCDHCRP